MDTVSVMNIHDASDSDSLVDPMLPSRSPFVGFLRHSPPQAMYDHFDQLLRWRSHEENAGVAGCDTLHPGTSDSMQPTLPKESPYVGSHRHAPPSPMLNFTNTKFTRQTSPPDFELDLAFEAVFSEQDEESLPSAQVLTNLPEEAVLQILSLVADIPRIGCLARVSSGVATLLKKEPVWAHRPLRIPPSVNLALLAPELASWLPAWRLVSKLIIPRSAQLIEELSRRSPDLKVEVAWRFDKALKGEGVEVVEHGHSVKRVPGAEEELVVLGDAPIPFIDGAHYLEVRLDDRSADAGRDTLNDFGIGVTASPPANIEELGAVAGEVPLSWVVDFTRSSVMLSVNNKEVAKERKVSAEDLEEGDRVGLRVTPAGSFEIYINGILREKLVPGVNEHVPRGVEIFPVLDLYGCTSQLSRTYAEEP